MSTSYETLELIASHHAELERLCTELMDLGGRVSAGDDRRVGALRERVRALGGRLRDHGAEEAAALLAEAGTERERVAALVQRQRAEVARLERTLADAERAADAPLVLAQAVCEVARGCRASLDRMARQA